MSLSPRTAGLLGLVLLGLGLSASLLLDSAPTTDAVSASQVIGDDIPRPTVTRTASRDDLAMRTGDAEQALDHWRSLFTPRGTLSLEDTKALVAERDAAAEALAAKIGALPPDAIPDVVSWLDGASTRDRLVAIDGLGRNPSADAVSALEAMYDDDEGYTNRANILRALGDSPAPGHVDLLVEQVWAAEDERLSQTAAMMLRGEASATASLTDALDSSLPINTRLEAVSSLGAVGTAAAQVALEDLSANPDVPARMRVYAEQELVRSFG